MTRRGKRMQAAALVAAGMAVTGGVAYRRHRKRNPTVTLYSEPGYRGVRQSFRYAGRAIALEETRLPKVGSIRVEQYQFTFRRAAAFPELLKASFLAEDPEDREVARRYLGLAAVRMLDPGSWRLQRDPAGDRCSWVQLWAVDPVGHTYSVAQLEAEGLMGEFLEDTPGVGDWKSRTRYIVPGDPAARLPR